MEQNSLLSQNNPPPIADSLIRIAYGMLGNGPLEEKIHFSFLTDKNRIVAVGRNHLFKTSPLAKRYGYRYSAIHSEMAAWQNAPRDIDFRKLRLWNVRLSRSSRRLGKPVLRQSKPCSCCASWLSELGLREIWHTTNEGWVRNEVI